MQENLFACGEDFFSRNKNYFSKGEIKCGMLYLLLLVFH